MFNVFLVLIRVVKSGISDSSITKTWCKLYMTEAVEVDLIKKTKKNQMAEVLQCVICYKRTLIATIQSILSAYFRIYKEGYRGGIVAQRNVEPKKG